MNMSSLILLKLKCFDGNCKRLKLERIVMSVKYYAHHKRPHRNEETRRLLIKQIKKALTSLWSTLHSHVLK